MELIATDGIKKSITIEGIQDVKWAPNKNTLVYTAFRGGEKKHAQVGFLEVPSRRDTIKTFNNT
jgi:hypothetical protein